jgi:hypothetical protein
VVDLDYSLFYRLLNSLKLSVFNFAPLDSVFQTYQTTILELPAILVGVTLRVGLFAPNFFGQKIKKRFSLLSLTQHQQ